MKCIKIYIVAFCFVIFYTSIAKSQNSKVIEGNTKDKIKENVQNLLINCTDIKINNYNKKYVKNYIKNYFENYIENYNSNIYNIYCNNSGAPILNGYPLQELEVIGINKLITNRIYNYKFDTLSLNKNYNILVAPFHLFEDCRIQKTNIESAIIARLYKKSDKDTLNLHIKLYELDTILSFNDAILVGEKEKVDLVIWGDLYEHCSNDNKACLKFVNISKEINVPGLDFKGETNIENFSSLSEITEGKLQKDIDYIIYWDAALRSISNNDFNRALYYFKIIERYHIETCELNTNLHKNL
ncbi:MAG: hypothetical protein HXX18_14475 [Bacteroidetes bacterium]|nr:hypothetical protein [Bacteroidota bacterium]